MSPSEKLRKGNEFHRLTNGIDVTLSSQSFLPPCIIIALVRVSLVLFNYVTVMVWQDELDWNETLIKRYVGREVGVAFLVY